MRAGLPISLRGAVPTGLGRLRWYCQVCEKQCRDENGFKMHAQSETWVLFAAGAQDRADHIV